MNMFESYIARKETAREYDIPGGSRCVLYQDSPVGNLSCAYVEMDGRYPEKGFRKNTTCTEATFVIEGALTFIVGGESILLGEGEVLYLPLNTPYAVEGKGKSFVFINPKWDPDQNVACEGATQKDS